MTPTPREQPAEPPRTRLLPRRARHEDDPRLLDIITSLPPVPDGARQSLAGICNGHGQVYRRVELFSALELFMLMARFNALGFAQESGARAGKHGYDVVFRKLPKRRSPRGEAQDDKDVAPGKA
ncbi:hypothetical protein GCM10028796_46030 [Ramlibacter monticola]|uniref:Uncharacterized protein n=1 Tax=Ramlibacter monticola TaxID=1926872 RepID=A0A937CVM5_9BURK|nr:hypothetical protein [Ramlibacter monticola]MBL0393227.1 hypothetical protein [Ramlibacter monticola]